MLAEKNKNDRKISHGALCLILPSQTLTFNWQLVASGFLVRLFS